VEVQCTDDFADGPLCDAWNGILTQTVNANAQVTHEWVSACWEIFGRRQRLSLMTVTEGDKITGIAPLAVATVMGRAGCALRKLTFVGDGLTDYHDLLIAEERREETLRVLVERLVRDQEHWDAIHFRNVRGDSPNLPILRNLLRDSPFTVVERINIRSPYIPIEGRWTDYYTALGKNVRSDVRRRQNGLARMGKAEFLRLHDIDDVAATLDIIKAIHVKCRRARGETSWYLDERRYRLVSLILQRFSERRWLDLVFLKLNDRVIAYYLGFRYNNIVHFWNTGYDPEFSEVSPGKLLLRYWIEDSFAGAYREFDFMVGEEPYKLQWARQTRPNYELGVFKNTARSHLFKCYYTYKPILAQNRPLRRIVAQVKSRINA
jgi:CelD/BcsL family acetyltransferase involved in cellulose biosynthesis